MFDWSRSKDYDFVLNRKNSKNLSAGPILIRDSQDYLYWKITWYLGNKILMVQIFKNKIKLFSRKSKTKIK